jgi:hypothetical protein
VKKAKGHAGREAIVAQVDKKNSFARLQMQNNPWGTECQPLPVRRSKAGAVLFWFGRCRNRKFSTTSLVHGVEYHFKTNTGATTVELVC